MEMKKENLKNDSGAMMVEAIISSLIIGVVFAVILKSNKVDDKNIGSLYSRWRATLVAESVLSTLSSTDNTSVQHITG